MIRQFQAGDAAACCRLVQECVAEDSSISPALRRKFISAETPDSMKERSNLFYVAVFESEDGRVLGVAGLDLNEIRLLCVDPQSRRHGIGRAFLEHFRSMVPGILFPDMFVYSSMRGRDFYRACGFVEKGPASFDFAGEQLQTIFMSLPINGQ